ncbi:hypothetical protein [Pseudoalteromonas luteoviolacea]|uniref:Uncharacterized protein n=1 Tax=Pseudoalteromonas luteoviolacea S4054 TaxID=1129367 RepID=A0A0F6AC60_9GAMM|nr:hypothetical protein [Pseudoalteromonas luteoviolacea]AOT10647.1 hypothetical protein S4054249_22570 [Pseudoalteromonas luteoviolacea]AOT15285.1 hypothetical protein S40542_21025 [Pseudoalteromonas luteoviolacea]AOT20466.1 hypothetical protein S4054_22485 [Pseudoalteromonas luteoviolacea]KKE83748.1 hypothetical protein N479_13045 [Pseudoalteromonas luteoviolacea S4054]KZN71952.1 hypothetical protein N481_17410 [Pseudoalteromonas luteoviolacea S4047-1]
METLTALVSAIVAGASVALKETTSTAIKESYQTLKAYLATKYPAVNLANIEKKPESEAKQESLTEDLVDDRAHQDPQLAQLCIQLKQALKQHATPEQSKAIVAVTDSIVGNVTIGKISADHHAEFSIKDGSAQDIKIAEVSASQKY